MLDGGNKCVNGVVGLCVVFCPQLVGCERVMGFCELCESGNKNAFKQFSKCVVEIDSSVGGRVCFVKFLLLPPFIDRLHE